MDVLTPLGNTCAEYWEGITSGRSGVGLITKFSTEGYTSKIAGEVRNFEGTARIPAKELRRMDPVTQYAVYTGVGAFEDSGLEITDDNAARVGVVIGTGIGGLHTLEEQYRTLLEKGPGRVSPFTIPMLIGDMTAGMLSIRLGAKGPNYTTTSACASGAHAMGVSIAHIRSGEADVMIAGGAEATVCPFGVASFCAARALSTRNDDPEHASRPFDKDRDGFVTSEGAGILVLEELEHAKARGAKIYAELLGYGFSGDAYHMTAPAEDGSGMARAMNAALANAQIDPSDVDYVNTHGTSTVAGDVAETAGIKLVFGDHARKLAISSTKSMIGHLLGAAGAVEMVATALSLRDGVITPTINLDNPDPACDLDYVPHTARKSDARIAISNSFGFGGHNATLVVKKWEG